MRHVFHFNGVSKVDEIVNGNENFLGFMANPKELIVKGNQANMIGFMSEHQKKKMMAAGLPKAEDMIKKIVNKYLISADFFNAVPWKRNIYHASKIITDSIKINLNSKQISSTFNMSEIELTETEKDNMFAQSGGELYNSNNFQSQNKYFNPINDDMFAQIMAGVVEDVTEAFEIGEASF